MGLLFRDINVLSAPNNSRNYTTVTAVRGGDHEDHRSSQGRKRHHQHSQHHGPKSTKRHCG